MSETGAISVPPRERVEDLPRIVAAMRRAVRRALRRHQTSGNPIAIWRDGGVVWIQPEDIPLEREE